ncbi:unnamed protein product [Rhizoctonia solani]|nr:unnamed protein product [Rhizoctonia solani]
MSSALHLEVLKEQLSLEDVSDALSVPVHVKGLELSGRVPKDSICHLAYIVPRLLHLSYIYWGLDFMPESLEWPFKCPALKSVHLWPKLVSTSLEGRSWIKQLPRFIQFTGLTHFSLKSRSIPYKFNEKHIRPLTSLLESSPNLESIILDLSSATKPPRTYSPTLIIEPLGDRLVLSQLRRCHFLGDADPDWFEFATEPTHPLRTFLARHTSIRDLAISCSTEVSGTGMELNNLPQLPPSIRHLAIPLFMCESVVESPLALHIESLAISNLSLHGDDPLGPLAEAVSKVTLPNLRKLEIWAGYGDFELGSGVFEAFVSAAKGLEELDFKAEVEDYDEFLTALDGAENLRQITVNPGQLLKPGFPITWNFALNELAEMCPRLEMILTHGGQMNRVIRDDSGEICWDYM